MQMQASQTESDKIEAFRTFLGLVVTNTKREMQGKAAQVDKEEKALSKTLGILLGRAPTTAELTAARKY